MKTTPGFCLTVAMLLAASACARAEEPFFTQQDLFVSGIDNVNIYRIPALIVSPKGSLLAFCEAREGDNGDPDPMRRYKLVANMQDHRMWAYAYPDKYPQVTKAAEQEARTIIGQYLDTSPDGIHWTRKPQRISHGAGGDYMMVLRDHRNRRWWLNERSAKGTGGRNAALRVGANWTDWSEPEIIFDNGPESEFCKRFEWHGGMTPFNYGSVNLGLLEKWPNVGFGATCELIWQPEGGQWERVAPGVPFLDVGPEGAFDRLLAYPTHNAPIRIGDTLHIYYTRARWKQRADLTSQQGKPIRLAFRVATALLYSYRFSPA